MHTEHLNNVRIGQVFLGWFIAFAVTSLLVFVLIATNLLDPATNVGSNWIALAVAVGFAAGGFYVGLIVALAPILHGMLIGMATLVIWAVVNVVVTSFFPDFDLSLTGELTVAVILVQTVAAIIGARFGYRYAVATP